MRSRKETAAWFTATAVIAAGLDLGSKTWVANAYERHGGPIEIIPGLLSFDYRLNQGGMWSAFASHGTSANWWLGLFSLAAVIGIILWVVFDRLPHSRRSAVVLGGILGGAVGNLVDRQLFGGVRDFIDAHYYQLYHWPTFNLADSFLVCGTLALVLGLASMQVDQEPTATTSLSESHPPAS